MAQILLLWRDVKLGNKAFMWSFFDHSHLNISAHPPDLLHGNNIIETLLNSGGLPQKDDELWAIRVRALKKLSHLQALLCLKQAWVCFPTWWSWFCFMWTQLIMLGCGPRQPNWKPQSKVIFIQMKCQNSGVVLLIRKNEPKQEQKPRAAYLEHWLKQRLYE